MRGVQDVIYLSPHLQTGEQVHASPHWQPVAWPTTFASWQPQVQDAPGQGEQLQMFELVDMGISDLMDLLDRANKRKYRLEVTLRDWMKRLLSLNKSATRGRGGDHLLRLES